MVVDRTVISIWCRYVIIGFGYRGGGQGPQDCDHQCGGHQSDVGAALVAVAAEPVSRRDDPRPECNLARVHRLCDWQWLREVLMTLPPLLKQLIHTNWRYRLDTR